MNRTIFKETRIPLCIFSTYQRVSSLVLVERAHPGPIELLEYGETRLVELVFRRDYAEKVRKASCRKHRVCVRIGHLKLIGTKDFNPIRLQGVFFHFLYQIFAAQLWLRHA